MATSPTKPSITSTVTTKPLHKADHKPFTHSPFPTTVVKLSPPLQKSIPHVGQSAAVEPLQPHPAPSIGCSLACLAFLARIHYLERESIPSIQYGVMGCVGHFVSCSVKKWFFSRAASTKDSLSPQLLYCIYMPP